LLHANYAVTRAHFSVRWLSEARRRVLEVRCGAVLGDSAPEWSAVRVGCAVGTELGRG
jgi:hypothetical protein